MKLIQILALVAALAVAAVAQNNTNSQPAGSSGQTGGTGSQKKKSVTPASSKSSADKSSHKGGTGAQSGPVTLTVKKRSQSTSATKTAAPVNSTAGKNTAGNNSKSKTGTQASTGQTSSAPGKTSATATAGKGVPAKGGTQTAPVIGVKSATQQPATGKATSAGKDKKKGANAAAVIAKKKTQVKVVPQKTAGNKKPPEAVLQQLKTSAANRRDPFVSIIRTAPLTQGGPNCTVGKRCLYIPELVLKGIAKDTDGQMLAVVVSNTQRAYFLRENDQVFNGSVQKITSDSVIFREFATDHLGRETAHEVVKRIPKT